LIDLGAPPGGNSFAYGINDAGQVVGYFTTAGGAEHAFLYHSGTMIDLGAPPGGNSYAYGINDAGQIVGYSTTADGAEHAFLYNDGTIIDLGVSLSGNSNAYGINNRLSAHLGFIIFDFPAGASRRWRAGQSLRAGVSGRSVRQGSRAVPE
jgi:probable HAF family extracellular repeat protein